MGLAESSVHRLAQADIDAGQRDGLTTLEGRCAADCT
jgi:hypothetical protein